MCVVDYITTVFNGRFSTGALFLDVAKIFDKIRHAGLIKTLKLGVPEYLALLIQSYFQD